MKITVETVVKADLNAVWRAWNNPEVQPPDRRCHRRDSKGIADRRSALAGRGAPRSAPRFRARRSTASMSSTATSAATS